MSEKTRAYIFLSLATFIWGSFFLASKIVVDVVPPTLILNVRYGLGAFVLGIVVLCTKHKRIKAKDMPIVILIGFVQFFLSVWAQIVGINYVTSSLASVISTIAPVFMILFAIPVLGERIRIVHVTALAITLTGVLINVGGIEGGSQLKGILLCLLSALFWALGSVYTRKICEKYNEFPVTFCAMLVAFLCSIPAAAFEVNKWDFTVNTLTLKVILLLIYNGVFCTAVAIIFWNIGLARIEATACSMFVPIQQIVATVLGVVILHELLDFRFIVGGGLVIAGVVYSMVAGNAFKYFERKRRRYLKLQAIRRKHVMRRGFSLENTQEDLRLMKKHFLKEAGKTKRRFEKNIGLRKRG